MRGPASRIDLVFQVGGNLEHVQQVRSEIWRHGRACARPIGEAAAAALEPLELLQCLLHRRPHLRRIDAWQRERITEIRGQQQCQRARSFLLGAAVRIFDEIACAFAEADHRRRRHLDVQPAESRHDAGRNCQSLVAVRCVAASP